MDNKELKSLLPKIEYYDNGNIKKIIYFDDSNGQMEKIKEEDYFENGQKRYERFYHNNELNGSGIEYYEEGGKKREYNHKNGVMDGLDTTYYKNGQKSMEGNRKHPMNRMVGKWYGWYENGEKMYESDSDENGNTTYTEWYKNGQKKEEGTLDILGMKRPNIVYDKDGSTTTDSNDIFKKNLEETWNKTKEDYNKNSKELDLDTDWDDFINMLREK
jgi:antitoxin component YwqK of YwqJK toxin-antitoxin module